MEMTLGYVLQQLEDIVLTCPVCAGSGTVYVPEATSGYLVPCSVVWCSRLRALIDAIVE